MNNFNPYLNPNAQNPNMYTQPIQSPYPQQSPPGYAPQPYPTQPIYQQAPQPVQGYSHHNPMGDLEEASLTKSGQYFKQGNFLVQLQNVFLKVSKDDETFFIIETIVHQSDNPEIKVGSETNQMIKKNKSAKNNILKFLAGVFGVDGNSTNAQREIEATFAQWYGFQLGINQIQAWVLNQDPNIGQVNPLKGMFIGVTAVDRPKRPKPGERVDPDDVYTHVSWFRVPQPQQ